MSIESVVVRGKGLRRFARRDSGPQASKRELSLPLYFLRPRERCRAVTEMFGCRKMRGEGSEVARLLHFSRVVSESGGKLQQRSLPTLRRLEKWSFLFGTVVSPQVKECEREKDNNPPPSGPQAFDGSDVAPPRLNYRCKAS